MAKDDISGPVGNRDPNKRGRDIPPGGRPSKNQPKSPGSGKGQGRSKDDPDTETYGTGGRRKK